MNNENDQNTDICFRFEKDPRVEIGGAERQMLLIADHIEHPYFNFHYIVKNTSKTGFKSYKHKNVSIETYGTNIMIRKPKLLTRMLEILNNLDLFLLLKFHKKLNFDIYHLRGANVITGFWALFSKIVKKKRFVFTIAGARDCIPGGYPWHPIFYKIYKYTLKKADLIIVIADYLKKLLYDNYSVKSIVIESGHPIPEGPFIKNDPPLILWIAGLKPVKRPELFLKIVKNLQDMDAEFLLIGPRDYKKEEILNLVRTQKNFRFIPGVSKSKDNLYYRKASLLVNTSSHEGYPNAFIQAWMHKTPVVSLKVDPDDVIKNHNLGFCANGSLSEMIKWIKKNVNNSSRLKSLGNNCRKFAIKNHNIKSTAKKHLRIYEKFTE